METQNQPDKTIGIVENPKNKKLIANLEKQANHVILFPEPKIEPVKNDFEIIENINNFDWLIFTDVHTVDCFLELLEEKKMNFFELDALRICALGEAVADRLRFQQLHSDVIPPNNQAHSVVTALDEYIFDENEFSGLRFLLIKQLNLERDISAELSKKKANVAEMSVYQSVFCDSGQIPKLKALVKGGGIDEFIFTAPEDVLSVSQLFGGESLRDVFAEIKITAKDEMSMQTFEENQ